MWFPIIRARCYLEGCLISDDALQEAVTEAGRHGSFDPDVADAVVAIQKTDAPVLILHGTDDWIVPPYHSMRLHAAARDHSQLVMMARMGHIAMWFAPANEVEGQTRTWFDHWLKTEASADAAGDLAKGAVVSAIRRRDD